MRVPWAPDDFAGALAVWERGMLDAHRGTLEYPAGRVHRVRLEDLVLRGREPSYAELLAFLEVPDTLPLRSFFETEVTAARARVGRWRADLRPSERADAEALYRRSLERLDAAGVAPLPPVDTTGERDWTRPAEPGRALRPEPAPAASAVDPWTAATETVEPAPSS
jgi:hypothetical protein